MTKFDLKRTQTPRERDELIRQLVQHIITISKRHNQTGHEDRDLKELPMAPIKYSHHGENSIIAIFRTTLTPRDIFRIESAAEGITVDDYTCNYDFWQEFIRAITEGSGIEEAVIYTIRCTEYQQLLNEALCTYIRLSQADNMIDLIPITDEVATLLRSTIEAFYLNKASVEAFAAEEYSRIEQNLQFFYGDKDSLAHETIQAVWQFKTQQEQLRQRHLKRLHDQIGQVLSHASL